MSKLVRALITAGITSAIVLGSCKNLDNEPVPLTSKQDTNTTQVAPLAKKIIPLELKVSPIDSILSEGCYTVEAGDNLYKIGETLYGEKTMGHAIADWNDIQLEPVDTKFYARIHPGQDLMVKKVEMKYVESGNGWWNIARNTGLTIDQAQEKFHWIGNMPTPGEVYFTE